MTDKFADYSSIEPLLRDVKLPKMFRVTQSFPRERIEDVAGETRRQLLNAQVKDHIRPGMTVAVTGSSRGIANMNVILREVVAFHGQSWGRHRRRADSGAEQLRHYRRILWLSHPFLHGDGSSGECDGQWGGAAGLY